MTELEDLLIHSAVAGFIVGIPLFIMSGYSFVVQNRWEGLIGALASIVILELASVLFLGWRFYRKLKRGIKND